MYTDSDPEDFVRHVAILREDIDLQEPTEVGVYHMGPPLVAGEKSAAERFAKPTCRADIASDVALDTEEREAIDDWLAQVEKQNRDGVKPFQQYVVHPHFKWVRSPETGRRIRCRFSCAGFVIECYRAADILLLDTDAELPEVDERTLRAAYPDLARLENREPPIKDRFGFKNREDLGIAGNGPWRVILAGYLFHSLKRATADNKRPEAYVPKSATEGCFSG